jgi:cytochrome c biogenesis protein
MRTALILLFLLALASVPGSLFPQRGTSPLKVSQYLRDHPFAGPILDRLSLFDVFASPWFAAVYLLLFISLAGCVLPRTLEHAKQIVQQPPLAPKNLSRLSAYVAWKSQVEVEQALHQSESIWKSSGWRVRTEEDWVSAEKGYSRETGNLLFHLALLVILVAVGFGGALGAKGTVIVREGSGFANNVTQYDTFTPGRLFSADQLPPFSFTLVDFKARYQSGGQQNGAARAFSADIQVRNSPTSTVRNVTIEVNEPLRIEGTSVYLVGHGYAPKFTVRNAKGQIVWNDAAVFLPQDGNFTSTGVVKAPDTVPQLGIQGFFLPTASGDTSRGPRSMFPAPNNPQVFLSAWRGDLGLDSGIPQSVYHLDTKAMTRIGIEELKPGEVWKLPHGQGTVAFTGFEEWASFSITRDPGKGFALVAAFLAIFGLTLSLLIPRRRMWLRITKQSDGSNLFEVAGLSKTEAPGLLDEVQRLATQVKVIAPEVTSVH